LLALVFGFFAFRSRIKGVYFSIITQALTFAIMLLFFRNDTGFGGNNGFTDFKRILGYTITAPSTKAVLYWLTLAVLVAVVAGCRAMMATKFGRALQAIRDAEARMMFLGYNPLGFKLVVWTLSAVICGIAGALYVPQVGIINPSEMSPANSIELVIWVAIGGRGTLIGPVIGAAVVNGLKSWFTAALPQYWLFVLGAIFIVVTLYLPRGLVGLAQTLRTRLRAAPSASVAPVANPISEPGAAAREKGSASGAFGPSPGAHSVPPVGSAAASAAGVAAHR
jgi:urea transport system permease protein